MIRFNHFADIHFRPSRALDVFTSLNVIERESEGVDFNIAAGDTWDYPVQNTGASQFPEYVARMSRIAEKAPIVMVQGTPTHDSDGSLDIFEQASENITILRMGQAYFLAPSLGGNVVSQIWNSELDAVNPKALIFGLPEPQKKHLIAADTSITMEQAVRSILMGYAAIRAKYPELPCILVYHGQVKGAKNPNGEPVEGGVSIDDLALVGADYIAMGDIHKPQRVGVSRGIHAYYPGAMYPTGDWKDAGYQFGFNQVTIGESFTVEKTSALGPTGTSHGVKSITPNVEIKRIPFPHPELVKFETKGSVSIPASESFIGKRVWWEISCSKEESVTINTEMSLHDLLAFGADSKSKVTLKLIADETVRAGEITSVRKLRDKFALWARNTKKETTDSLLDKCDELETLVSGKGLIAQGGSFSFDKMILRGAKGIWKKQRKDEITLDLASYDTGIIGLVGPNGRGKSTIINNFHVWPEMPNMGGPLHKQFRLKDSKREVYATEHNTGKQYRARMLINAPGKTAEYYLEEKCGDEYVSVPGITGRLSDYETVVTSIFGTLDMYIRTAMQMQTPTDAHPDLSKATKGEKKAVMAALAGIDYYALYKAEAKGKADGIESKIAELDTRIRTMEDGRGDEETLERSKCLALDKIAVNNRELPAKEAEGKIIADRVKLLEQTMASQNVIHDQIDDLTESFNSDTGTKLLIEHDLESVKSSVASLPENVATVNRYELLKSRETEINAEKTAYLEESAKLSREYQTKKDAYTVEKSGIEKELNAETNAYNQQHSAYVSNRMVIDRDVERLKAELAKPITDHCPTCAQLLPADAIEHVKKERAETEKKIETLALQAFDVSEKIAQLDKEHEGIVNAIESRLAFLDEPQEATRAPFDEVELKRVQADIRSINIESARKVVTEAATASVRIDSLTERITEVEKRIITSREKLEELKPKIDASLPGQLEESTTALNRARSEYQTLTERLATAKAELKFAEDAILKYSQTEREIATFKEKRELNAKELNDWRTLEQATGQSGIVALELDALSPSIAAIATTLLEEYEDGRYSIRFDTTREGNKGNQIEDFLIMVIDSVDGDEQELDTLSGGESAWVRKALSDAFGIIRANNAGVKYLTGFLDESDSALFPESRIAYFRMLQSAFKQSGRIHTIMVSHSPEIQEMLSQKIDVTSLV